MPWTCDNCGQPINAAEDGYVEWLAFNGGARNLHLVHHSPASPRRPNGDCYFDEEAERRRDGATVRSLSLTDFLGPNGLMQLLILLSEGELPKDEVIEMIQRIHIPGYEQARPHFARALAEGVFEPNTPEGFYWQNDINAVLKFAAQHRLNG
jgi:hypothetical protein